MQKKRNYWKKGEKQTLAKNADTSAAALSKILGGQIRASEAVADRLAIEAGKMGLDIEAKDFVFNDLSANKLLTKNAPWKPGQKSELAERAGIEMSHLSRILNGHLRPGPELANRIATEAWKMKIPLHRDDLLFPEESKSLLLEINKP